MTISEPTDKPPFEPVRPSLADRRPGHAAISYLLRELDRRGLDKAVPPDLASWHVGAIGEQLVGAELARLPEGWRVLHAVPAGASADIDHLVFGPPGAFVLNTKRHPAKRIRVGTHVVWIGSWQENFYQRRLLERAEKVRLALEATDGAAAKVYSMLVFVDAESVEVVGQQTVLSCSASGLVDRLLALEPVISAPQVEDLYRRASRPEMWGRPESVLSEPDPTSRFVELTVLSAAARSIARPPQTRPRARTATTGPRRTRARQPAAKSLAIRLMGGMLALTLFPIAMTIAIAIFSAIVHALLIR